MNVTRVSEAPTYTAPLHRDVAEKAPTREEMVYVVLDGELVITTDEIETVLGKLDSAHLARGEIRSIENRSGREALLLVASPYPQTECDENERPTADLNIARRAMDLISGRCPILIQMSTGVGLTVPFEDREKLVELRPRMATLNPCSMSFGADEFRNPPNDVRRLAARMRELDIKPELEIYDTGHLEACLRLWEEGLLAPLQFSIVLGVRGGMAATADNLLTMVRRLPPGVIWQVIAIGRANLELTAMGLALGGNARVGLEDTLYLRMGELAPGNLQLALRTLRLAEALDLPIASVDETEALLQLPGDH